MTEASASSFVATYRPSLAARRLRALIAEPKVTLGGGFILALIVIAVFAPWIAPKNPLDQDLMIASVPPAGFAGAEPGYLLGADDLGRDVLSRLIYGSRIALIVAFVAASLAALIGTALGLIAGWYRGWAAGLISRLGRWLDLAAGRRLDGVPAGPALHSPRRGSRRGRRIGHRRDRDHRLDAVLPGRA